MRQRVYSSTHFRKFLRTLLYLLHITTCPFRAISLAEAGQKLIFHRNRAANMASEGVRGQLISNLACSTSLEYVHSITILLLPARQNAAQRQAKLLIWPSSSLSSGRSCCA